MQDMLDIRLSVVYSYLIGTADDRTETMMMKRTSPSKYTMRQMQDEMHAHMMANLESSSLWDLPRDQLEGIKASLQDPRLNPNLAVVVGEIIKRRFA